MERIINIGSDNEFSIDPSVEFMGTGSIHLKGSRNLVAVGPGVRIGMTIDIPGDDNVVQIGMGVVLVAGYTLIVSKSSQLVIGDGTSIESAELMLHETSKITLGRHCMISSGVLITVSDVHSIFDESGMRVNPAKPVIVEDGVWIGRSVMVLKGARIGAGAIVGAGTIVTGSVEPRTMVAGAPFKVIRRQVRWDRRLIDSIEPL